MKSEKAKNVALWIVQGLLAAVFVFAGGMKLVLPIEAMQGPVALPGAFVKFIGLAEVLGALGLVLPWALRIRRVLTPLAACGLVTIMIGAVAISAATMGAGAAVVPFVVGTLAGAVAWGRRAALHTRATVSPAAVREALA